MSALNEKRNARAAEVVEDIKSRCTLYLDLPPSCIREVPGNLGYFVIGTYYLEDSADVHSTDIEHEEKDNVASDHTQLDGNVPHEESMIEEDETVITDSPHEEAESRTVQRQERRGSLVLIRVDDRSDNIKTLYTLPTPSAVLDISFNPYNPRSFHVVSSTGTFSTYTLIYPIRIQDAELSYSPIQHVLTQSLFPESTLITSIRILHQLVVLTTSTSIVTLFHLKAPGKHLEPLVPLGDSLTTHSGLEAWCILPICRTDSSTVIFSGGDDSLLKCSPGPPTTMPATQHERQAGETKSWSSMNGGATRQWKLHSAGVTALAQPSLFFCTTCGAMRVLGQGDLVSSGVFCHDTYVGCHSMTSQQEDPVIITGSYDEHIRVIDTATNRGVRAELRLGGGVWQIEPLPSTMQVKPGSNHSLSTIRSDRATWGSIKAYWLVSSMHAGAAIVESTYDGARDEWELKLVARFEEHESMCYASTGWSVNPPNIEQGIVSTSFYDRRVCFWRWKPKLELATASHGFEAQRESTGQ